MKYLVMETFNSYAVLLDEDGRFVKSANLNYEIGDTVKDPVLMQDKPLEKVRALPKRSNKVVAAIVAIAAMVTLFFGVNFYQQNYMPYTSIFMAINPEVEMILNRNGEVIDVEGANADGTILLEEYEPTSKDKTVILNELVDRAIEMGFLSDGGQVSISIDTPDEDLFKQYGIELRRELDGRTTIMIQITDIENKNTTPTPTPPPTNTDDDSGYDDSGYNEPNTDDTNDDSGYDDDVNEDVNDDSGYDEPDDDDSGYGAVSQPQPVSSTNNNDDSDYDDSAYDDDSSYDDDSGYDDSAYDD